MVGKHNALSGDTEREGGGGNGEGGETCLARAKLRVRLVAEKKFPGTISKGTVVKIEADWENINKQGPASMKEDKRSKMSKRHCSSVRGVSLLLQKSRVY
jgi:hypothetical protein